MILQQKANSKENTKTKRFATLARRSLQTTKTIPERLASYCEQAKCKEERRTSESNRTELASDNWDKLLQMGTPRLLRND